MPTIGVPPSARFAHSAIYDVDNRRMVIFGGGSPYLNDVWELPVASLQWNPIVTFPSPAIGLPAGRIYHRAVYDPLNRRMVAFGGGNQDFICGDTWELPLSGTPQWKALSPTPRLAPLTVVDTFRAQMMVFGGLGPTGGVLEDVWAYGLTGPAIWIQILPSGPPPPRILGSVIYDRANNRFVLFGGFGVSEYNDVWALSIGPPAAWTQLMPGGAPPAARYGHTAVYDEAGGRMLVFGGRTNLGAVDDDVWALRLNGPPLWTQHNTPGPSTRDGHVAVLDPVHWGDPTTSHMLVFGGTNLGLPLSDTWDWISNLPSWDLLPAGSPGDRTYSTAVYDAPRDRMLLFGGNSAGGPKNDLWQLPFYDTKVWSQQFPMGSLPQARAFAGGVYDLFGNRMLVTGGRGGVVFYNDLWQLNLSAVPVGVPSSTVGAEFRMGPIAPNPSTGKIRFSLDLAQAGSIELTVHDVAGRIAHTSTRAFPAGRHELGWSGHQPGGERARAGVYLVRVKVGAQAKVERFVLLP